MARAQEALARGWKPCNVAWQNIKLATMLGALGSRQESEQMPFLDTRKKAAWLARAGQRSKDDSLARV